MKNNLSIKLKAAFLIMIFSLNTIVGFACAVGVDMGFNTKHHHDEEATEEVVHVHKDGKKHLHQEKKESHSHSTSHHHDAASNNDKSKTGDNCCNNKVRIFEQLDKSVPNLLSIVHPAFLSGSVASFYNISLLPYSNVVTDKKQFVRSYHPPIPDIRIAIQSFQI